MATYIALSTPKRQSTLAWLWAEYKDSLRILIINDAYSQSYTVTRLTVIFQFTTALAVVAAARWITKRKGRKHG